VGRELKVAILLGGPSDERAISLNSARSVADHLEGDGVVIEPIVYFDTRRRPFLIDRKRLYSNTPMDFDFKLSQVATSLTEVELGELLRRSDIAFPVMHGSFGEDGEVQQLLERIGVPYVGSSPEACRVAYDKYLAHEALRAAGLPTVPSVLFSIDAPGGTGTEADRRALDQAPSVVMKPSAGGSSLGVVVLGPSPGSPAGIVEQRQAEIGDACLRYQEVVLQPFVHGVEFTTIVIEGPLGPVALLPVEVELRRRSSPDEIFSFRHKYLATDDARYHCPPRQGDDIVAAIRASAEQTFRVLGLRDFARIDCWLDSDGQILISDVNPISGMEQNSFLFIQGAEVGMTHADVVRLVLSAACRRAGLALPVDSWRAADARAGRTSIPVLFGGRTAERDVSVLSGTNVWMKLIRSRRFDPAPYLLEDASTVWELPYPLALRHSADQIIEACRSAAATEKRRQRLADEVAVALDLESWQRRVPGGIPRRMSLDEFLTDVSFVFLGLHGGMGEDGTLQRELEARGIAYNGSGPEASRLCIDKYATGLRLAGHEGEGIFTSKKVRLTLAELGAGDEQLLWRELVRQCGTTELMVKPLADGCSTGVVPLASAAELRLFSEALASGATRLPRGLFSGLAADQVVELPTAPSELLFEAYVATDDIAVMSSSSDGGEPAGLEWGADAVGWIEITAGVLGTTDRMTALSPSFTVAKKGVLSVEEKFMGGTGINITPPPSDRVAIDTVARARGLIGRVANLLGIRGYARIDAFMHCDTGDIIVIEANTLPGLTPSTVLYHQALEEVPSIYPRDLLERIIDLGFEERVVVPPVVAVSMDGSREPR
jgi:D-alanine--D-alanine ligase